MSTNSIEAQRILLAETQKRHARELIINGIAQRAFRRRFDEDWYSDTATVDIPSESLPVVMFDGGNPGYNNYLYVYLLSNGDVSGAEVNIADIRKPGTPDEIVVPIEGFMVNDATIVKSLVDELLARKKIDIPNLSDDLLGISA